MRITLLRLTTAPAASRSFLQNSPYSFRQHALLSYSARSCTEVVRTARRRNMRSLGALLLCAARLVLAQTVEDAPQLITERFVPTFVDLSGGIDPNACRPNLDKVDFAAATVAINNLGGIPGGPVGRCREDGERVPCEEGLGACTEYEGEEQVRFDCLPDESTPQVYKLEGVSFNNGERVDLTVSVVPGTTGYTTVDGNTGRQTGATGMEVLELDSIGVLSQDIAGDFLFKFSFEDGSDATLDELIFAIYDVDQDGADGEAGTDENFVQGVSLRERVVVTPIDATLLAYYITDTTQVSASESGGVVTVNSMVTGLGALPTLLSLSIDVNSCLC
eukprot:6211286-Pleurochrysis_carterae.AAC.2